MQINGNSAKQNQFIARSANQRSDKPETTPDQNGDTYVIRDTDSNPNLQVSVRPGPFIEPPQLLITNPDEKKPGGEGDQVMAFELYAMGDHEAGVLATKDLTGQSGVGTVSVQRLGEGSFQVLIGEPGPDGQQQGFIVRENLDRL